MAGLDMINKTSARAPGAQWRLNALAIGPLEGPRAAEPAPRSVLGHFGGRACPWPPPFGAWARLTLGACGALNTNLAV